MTRSKPHMTRRDAIGLTGAAIAMSSTGTASAQSYKAPGVYVEEVSVFPRSIAQVETAVPLFIGFTQKSVSGRKLIYNFADFRREFGETNAQSYEFASLTLPGAKSGFTSRSPAPTTRSKSSSAVSFDLRPAGPGFYLEEAVRLFFENGGAKCFIQSAGQTTASANPAALTSAIQALPTTPTPEFTLLVVPDAVRFSTADALLMQQQALFFCDSVRTVFAVLDVSGTDKRTSPDPVPAFRNGIGGIGLSHGAAYLPWLKVRSRIGSSEALNWLSPEARRHLGEFIEANGDTLLSGLPPMDRKPVLTAVATLKKASSGSRDLGASETRLRNALPFVDDIASSLAQLELVVPPSGAVTGVYARQDRDRGVWKAPAGIGLNGVTGLAYDISHAEQEGLNNPPGGRAINAIRAFSGRGIQVWGGRTMSTETEYKYVSVRRYCMMVEASLKKGLEWVVFEPNDEPLWATVRGSVENFLTTLWRNGALQGSKPEQAYYVRCGRGQTMTQNDIDAGRMIVEIGMAVTIPAEFLILRQSFMTQT